MSEQVCASLGNVYDIIHFDISIFINSIGSFEVEEGKLVKVICFSDRNSLVVIFQARMQQYSKNERENQKI